MTRWSNNPVGIRFRTIDGLAVRVAESDSAGQHALLLSPWPETLLAFEQLWAPLAEHAHLVAVDLPGFGRSQRRDSLLAPAAMGDFVIRVADTLGLASLHAVGPGDTTAALLFAAASNPGRFCSLVVGGGPAAVPLALGGDMHRWVTTADVPLGIDSAPPITELLRHLQREWLPDEVREDYASAYTGDRLAKSMAYLRAYPSELPVLGDRLSGISTPVQIIAGRRDPLVPPANAEFLRDRLPHSRLALLDAGHFVWEDAADQYAALVMDWWNVHRAPAAQ